MAAAAEGEALLDWWASLDEAGGVPAVEAALCCLAGQVWWAEVEAVKAW